MQHQAVLSVLQGPTKALVGSALGAGLATSLALSGRNPALCYVERLPYDDETFKSMYGSQRERALASAKPRRPVGWDAVQRLSSPSHVAFTLARCVGLATLVRVNMWLALALAEEEKAEEEGREPEVPELTVGDLLAAVHRGGYNGCIELVTQATRAVLDQRALAVLPPSLAKKLVKDLRQSAVRKGRLPWYLRSVRTAKTAVFSDATWWLADFLVAFAQEAVWAARTKKQAWQDTLLRLAKRCALHAARAVVVLAAVSVGNGVGAAMPRGRSFCMWLATTAASFVVNGYMFALINRLAPLPAPAGGDAGDAGAPAARQQQQQQQRAAGAAQQPFLMVGQQVHPGAAMAFAAAAAAGAAGAPEAGEQLANGAAELAGQPRLADAAVGPDEPAAVQDAGVQAGGGPGAAEPPIPAPQQRRVVGGPRLPDRPARRPAAAGPGPEGGAAAAAGAFDRGAPPPQAPHTPLYRDQRAPTPAGDSEETEAKAAAAAASPAGSTPGAGSSQGTPAAAASPAGGGAPGASSSAAAGGAAP